MAKYSKYRKQRIALAPKEHLKPFFSDTSRDKALKTSEFGPWRRHIAAEMVVTLWNPKPLRSG